MSKVFVIRDGKPTEYESIETLKEDIGEEEFNKLEPVVVNPQPKQPPLDAIPYHMLEQYVPSYMPDGQSSRRHRRAQERKPKKKNKPIWK